MARRGVENTVGSTGQHGPASGPPGRHPPPARNVLASRVAMVIVGATGLLAVGCVALQLSGPERSLPGDIFGGLGGLSAMVLSLSFVVVGGFLVARLPENRMGWLFCVTGVAICLSTTCWQYADAGLNGGSAPWPAAALAAAFPGEVVAPLLGLSLLLFPDGRLPSRRWWPAPATLLAAVALLLVTTPLRPGPFDPPFSAAANPLGIAGLRAEMDALNNLGWLLTVVGMAAAGATLASRLRHAHGMERRQLKLVLTAGAAAATLAAAVLVSWFIWPEGRLQLRMAVVQLSLTILPVAAGLSILRYRLYDLDVVVNRTLVYAVLTVTLACAYLGSVLTLQLLLNGVTGNSSLAVAVSTLAVAALFRPARARIQRSVDRRFYRRRYDARRTVESFTARLRHQVDLDAVSTDLREVVAETMQPDHVSLWLRAR